MSKASDNRCECQWPVRKDVDENMVECETCGGWVALRITTMEAWEKFKQHFVKRQE